MKKYYIAAILLVAAAAVGIYLSGTGKNEERREVKGNFTSVETYIDVRTDDEWQAGHLDGAMHFDLAKLQQGQLPSLSKDTPIALYCRSGHRAGLALEILKQNGFTTVRNAGSYETLKTQGGKICLGSQVSCN